MNKPIIRNHNNAKAFEHTEDHLLEFFSKAGSLFIDKKSFYGDEATALGLFKNAWRTGRQEDCIKLLFWLREIRGIGAGNRSGTRAILKWLANDEDGAKWLKANLPDIPEYGRWDDLYALYGTPLESHAMFLWSLAIKDKDGLACKWADPQDGRLRRFMKLSPKAFRTMIVDGRNVVETQMCNNQWRKIDYSRVPSVAIGRYNKAFFKHDAERYSAWRKSLVKTDENGIITLSSVSKINAGAVFPHDLIRTVCAEVGGFSYWNQYRIGTPLSDETNKMIEAQFLSMKDYIDSANRRVIPIVDLSGSMWRPVAGSIQAMDVALGLGLYCSHRLGEGNPFYKQIIPFSNDARIYSWEKQTFAEAVLDLPKRDGYAGKTNIKAALDMILNSAKLFKVPNNKMPNALIILSDMQFDEGSSDDTPVNESLDAWVANGYDKPSIIYWNLAGYANQPATKFDKNVAMVSGFSPSILTSVLDGSDLTPIGVMRKALEKYNVVNPS